MNDLLIQSGLKQLLDQFAEAERFAGEVEAGTEKPKAKPVAFDRAKHEKRLEAIRTNLAGTGKQRR